MLALRPAAAGFGGLFLRSSFWVLNLVSVLAPAPLALPVSQAPAGEPAPTTAQSQSVPYFGSTYYIVEAENFTTTPGGSDAQGWSPKVWGKDPNYFASVCFNTFMSRRAYLHAEGAATAGNATAIVDIAGAGAYAVLVRYEGLATHDAAFRVVIEQAGEVKYDRVYGRLANWKMWAFAGSRIAGAPTRGGLNGTQCGAEGPYALAQACIWNYGASENMLYEGTGNSTVGHPPATLDAGPAKITISLDGVYSDSDRLHRADRNLDLVMLTSNLTDLQKRVANDTSQLPSLDGLISQHGEVFFRAMNTGSKDLTLVIPATTNTSPDDYQQPLRFPIVSPTDNRTIVSGCTLHGPASVCKGCRCPLVPLPLLDKGDWSLWIEVGSLMDTFMPGTWTIANLTMPGQDSTPLNQTGVSFAVQFGVRTNPGVDLMQQPDDGITMIAEHSTNGASMQFNFDSNTQATRLMNPVDSDLVSIMASLDAQTPSIVANHLSPPRAFPIYADAYGSPAGNAAQLFYDSNGTVPLFTWGGLPGVAGPDAPGASILENTSANRAMTSRFQSMFQQGPDYPKQVTAADPKALIYMRGAFYDPAFSAGLTANGSVPPIIYERYLSPMKNLCQGCNTTAYGEHIIDLEAVLAVDFGDEFTIPFPDNFQVPPTVIDPIFVRWLQTKMKLASPFEAGCAGMTPSSSWAKDAAGCHYLFRSAKAYNPKGEPEVLLGPVVRLFYYSGLFARDWGLEVYKNITAPMQAAWPNAGIGFNQPTPFTSIGNCAPVFQWIRSYREGVMSLPWTEDWSWATPLGTQQMQQLALDSFRSGMRDRNLPANTLGVWSGAAPIHTYVMPHTPGNTANSWRRQFFADINHGMKELNLFVMAPFVQKSGPNAVDTWDENHMYLEVRKSLSELGAMEDIILHGTAQAFGADVALLISESFDIMSDLATPVNLLGRAGTVGAVQRTLYIALRHLQHPVDIIIEEDCEVPAVLNRYSSVYLSDPNLKQTAAAGVTRWLESANHTLWASAGAGMLNEFNVSSSEMLALSGLQSYTIMNQSLVQYVKQDLAFVPVLDTVSILSKDSDPTLEVFGILARMQPNSSAAPMTTVHATFADGSPAVQSVRQAGGGGRAVTCAFAPSLTYFHKAIPPMPTQRGATDENFNHMCPKDFDLDAKVIVAIGVAGLPPPPTLASAPGLPAASHGLIETGVVTAPGKGTVIPIVDWTGAESTASVTITLSRPIAFTATTLASGGAVTVAADKMSFVVAELKIADAIILR